MAVVAGKLSHCETLARTAAYFVASSGDSFRAGGAFALFIGFVMSVFSGPVAGGRHSSSSIVFAELAGVSVGGNWEEVDLNDEAGDPGRGASCGIELAEMPLAMSAMMGTLFR